MNNNLSRMITGFSLIFVSTILFILGFSTMFVFWIYSILILIVGLFILFNKKEDEIEKRKDLNKKENK